MDGLDLSPELLDMARERVQALKLESLVTLVEADITKASRKAREERLMATTGLSSTEVAAMINKAADGAQGDSQEGKGRRRGNRRQNA